MIPTFKLITADVLDGLKQIEDNSIDLIVTSPPYNLSIGYDIWQDNLPWQEYYDWCEKWLKELLRVLKPDGRLCLNHYMSFGNAEFRTAPLMELNSIAIRLGYKHHTVAMWLDRTLAKRTAWGSWLSASAPYINCMLPGTKIYTSRGLVNIENIQKNDEVLTHLNNFKEVLEIYSQKYDGDIFNIDLLYNKVSALSMTGYHKLFVKKRTTNFSNINSDNPKFRRNYSFSDNPEWLNCEEIFNNFNKSSGRKNEVRYYLGFPKNKKSTLPDFIKTDDLFSNPLFWKFVGLFLAEGNLLKMLKYYKEKKIRNYEINITTHFKEKDYVEKLFKSVNLKFGTIHNYKNSIRYSGFNKKVFEFLLQFFKPESYQVKGTKSYLKILPQYVIDMPIEYLQNLLDGYFFGDGNTSFKRNTKYYNISSTSYDLLMSFQLILLKLNKFATIEYSNRKEKNIIINNIKTKSKISYQMRWYDNQTKEKRVIEDDYYFYFPIKNIMKEHYEGIVYDMSVKDDESYCSMLTITHNSPYEGILILYKDKWKKSQKGKSLIDKDEFVSLTRGIWNIPTEPKGLTKANFPVALPDKCIKLLAYENSLILDPFSGAGTTGVAAIKNNCNYIGIEISPNYNKIAEDRLKKN